MLLPVVLAGGSGKRLWPLSSPNRPKPFAPLFEGEPTLFERTVARSSDLTAIVPPLILCNQTHEALVRSQMPLEHQSELILEPEPRDTAAAVCIAALRAKRLQGAATCLCIMPADHHIADREGFARTIAKATAAAKLGRIVTVAIPPTRPATEFGYLNLASAGDGFHEVQTFIEKPDAARASELTDGPNFWNAGIFVARADVLLSAFKDLAPDILECCSAALAGSMIHPDKFAFTRKISFDYAIMEKHAAVAAVRAEFDWQDLGNWSAVHAASSQDHHGNAGFGNAYICKSRQCYVRAANLGIAVDSCSDLLAMEHNGLALVAQLSASANMRTADSLPRQILVEGETIEFNIPWCGGKVEIRNVGNAPCAVACAF